jgi:hypothetical protein
MAKRMVRSVDLVAGLASTIELLAELGMEKVKSFTLQQTEESFAAALGAAAQAWLATTLTDDDKAKLAELAASKAETESKFNARISKEDLDTLQRITRISAKSDLSPAAKIAQTINAASVGEERKAAILAELAEAVKDVQAEIDELNDKKLVAARDTFAKLYDLDLTPVAVRVAGQQRVSLDGNWQFLPYEGMGEFVYLAATESVYYRAEGMEIGQFLGHVKIGSRSHGVKVAAQFWLYREQFPKDVVGRFAAALEKGKTSGYTTTLGVGKVDDAHPHGSFCKQLDKLPKWVTDAQAAIAQDEEEKPQK